MSEWIRFSDSLPPIKTSVLVYGPDMGILSGRRYHSPAWKPFNEDDWKGLPPEIIDAQRRLNQIERGRSAEDWISCTCEDSSWDLDKFSHWMPLPEEPKE